MRTLPLGIILIFLVLGVSVDSQILHSMLNLHALMIVLGGSFAILAMSTPLRPIVGLFKSLKDLKNNDVAEFEIEKALKTLAQDRYREDVKINHPLIEYAQSLWEQGLEPYLFEALLGHKIEELSQRTERPVLILRNLAKYPPALGMTGTVIGMISLFANLNDANKSQVGPNLALAMTATFMGLATANFIIMPLADRLQIRHVSRQRQNETIYKSLLLINNNEPLSVVKNTFIRERNYVVGNA